MKVFIADAGFNQERPTTLQAFIRRVVQHPKANGLTTDQILTTASIAPLVEVFGMDRIRKLIEEAKSCAGT